MRPVNIHERAGAGTRPALTIGLILLLVLRLVALTGCDRLTGAGHESDDGLPRLTIQRASGGAVTLRVELADTPEKMTRGLMDRQSLPQDQGMLFVFAQPGRSPFWMKNTYIPLSIAFIGTDGRILHIEDMQPLTETFHTPPMDYQYALEVNQGWFRAHNVTVGDRVRIKMATLVIGDGA